MALSASFFVAGEEKSLIKRMMNSLSEVCEGLRLPPDITDLPLEEERTDRGGMSENAPENHEAERADFR